MVRPGVVAGHCVEMVGEGRGRHRKSFNGAGRRSAGRVASGALGGCSQIGQSRRRRVDVDQYRLRDVAAAALDHPHREPASLRRKGETQRRGCRDRLLPGTPPQDTPGAAFARGDREPAQHAVVVRPEPCERRAAFRRAQAPARRPTADRRRCGSGRPAIARGRAPRPRAPVHTADAAARSRRRHGCRLAGTRALAA